MAKAAANIGGAAFGAARGISHIRNNYEFSGIGGNAIKNRQRGAVSGWSNKNIADTPYQRPNNATTKAQRDSVQGQACVDCGNKATKMIADHKTPLVVEHYSTGKINKEHMRSLEAVQPQCPTCSAKQGGSLSQYSKRQKGKLKK